MRKQQVLAGDALGNVDQLLLGDFQRSGRWTVAGVSVRQFQ